MIQPTSSYGLFTSAKLARIPILILLAALTFFCSCKGLDHWINTLDDKDPEKVLKAIKWIERYPTEVAIPPLLQFLWNTYPHPHTSRAALLVQEIIDTPDLIFASIDQFTQTDYSKKIKLLETLYRLTLTKMKNQFSAVEIKYQIQQNTPIQETQDSYSNNTNEITDERSIITLDQVQQLALNQLKVQKRLILLLIQEKSFNDALIEVKSASSLLRYLDDSKTKQEIFELWGDVYYYKKDFFQAEKTYEAARTPHKFFWIGNVFAQEILEAIYPMDQKRTLLKSLLDEMEQQVESYFLHQYRDMLVDRIVSSFSDHEQRPASIPLKFSPLNFDIAFSQDYTGFRLLQTSFQEWMHASALVHAMIKEVNTVSDSIYTKIEQVNPLITKANQLGKDAPESLIQRIEDQRNKILNQQSFIAKQKEQIARIQQDQATAAKAFSEDYRWVFDQITRFIKMHPINSWSVDSFTKTVHEIKHAYQILGSSTYLSQWNQNLEEYIASGEAMLVGSVDASSQKGNPSSKLLSKIKSALKSTNTSIQPIWTITQLICSQQITFVEDPENATSSEADTKEAKQTSSSKDPIIKPSDVLPMYSLWNYQQSVYLPWFVKQLSQSDTIEKSNEDATKVSFQCYDLLSGSQVDSLSIQSLNNKWTITSQFYEDLPLLIQPIQSHFSTGEAQTQFTWASMDQVLISFSIKDLSTEANFRPHIGIATLQINKPAMEPELIPILIPVHSIGETITDYYWIPIQQDTLAPKGTWNITLSIGDTVQKSLSIQGS